MFSTTAGQGVITKLHSKQRLGSVGYIVAHYSNYYPLRTCTCMCVPKHVFVVHTCTCTCYMHTLHVHIQCISWVTSTCTNIVNNVLTPIVRNMYGNLASMRFNYYTGLLRNARVIKSLSKCNSKLTVPKYQYTCYFITQI